MHYSADILYKNNNKNQIVFQKYFNKIKSSLYKTYWKTKQSSSKYYNKNEQILYKNNNSVDIILNQNSNENNLTLYRDCNKNKININNKLKLLNTFAFSMCLAICSNNIWQFYKFDILYIYVNNIDIKIDTIRRIKWQEC